jgi:hypothetical protein
MTATCTIAGCGRPFYAHGWCVTHYQRWQRLGHPQPDTPVRPRTTDGTSYAAVRRRVRAERGPASAQACAECGAPAVCWSYDGTDPDERTHPVRGVAYSLDLARYRPRCRFCRRRRDHLGELAPARRRAPDLDVARAIRLYQAGASCRGIGAVMGISTEAVRSALRANGVALRASGRPRR